MRDAEVHAREYTSVWIVLSLVLRYMVLRVPLALEVWQDVVHSFDSLPSRSNTMCIRVALAISTFTCNVKNSILG